MSTPAQFTHSARAEVYSPQALGNSLPQSLHQYCELNVPVDLPERRIYLYLEVEQAGGPGGYILGADVVLWRPDGRIDSILPATINDFTSLTPNESTISYFNAGGSPVGDSIVMRIANPFVAGFTSAVLQPVRVNANIAKVSLGISSRAGTMTGWRALLACLSTLY